MPNSARLGKVFHLYLDKLLVICPAPCLAKFFKIRPGNLREPSYGGMFRVLVREKEKCRDVNQSYCREKTKGTECSRLSQSNSSFRIITKDSSIRRMLVTAHIQA